MSSMRIPERRRHVRIVTLKNAVWFVSALAVLFMAYSTYNELRSPSVSRESLSEWRSRDAQSTPAATRSAVVEEQPVSDHTFARNADGRDLSAQPLPTTTPPMARTVPAPARRPTLKETRQRGERTVITGDADGVRLEVQPAVPTTSTDH